MATLTISDSLYEQLKTAAADQQKSVDALLKEAIDLVSRSDSPLEPESLTRDEKTQRLRAAMGDRVWSEEDINRYFDKLNLPPMTDEEVDRIVAAIKPLDPPLSQTVIEMRDEERY